MLFPINKKIAWLNYGGCGIFAVALYKELMDHGYKPSIVILQSFYPSETYIKKLRYKDIPELRNCRIKGIEPNDGAHSHYGVKIGSYIIDSKGAYKMYKEKRGLSFINWKPWEMLYVCGSIPVAELDYLNGFGWCWNSRFKRSYKSRIETFINKQINKLFIA